MHLYGLIGKKLGHSFSADFFNSNFKKKGIDAVYRLFEMADLSDLPSLIARHPNLMGFNVTVPYKQSVIPFIDFLSPEAEEADAVNCVKITRESTGKSYLRGYNTDIAGFSDMIRPFDPKHGMRAMIAGSGGASRGVETALRHLGVETTIVSRTQAEGKVTYSELNRRFIERYQFIINTTPLGMWPEIETAPPIPYEFILPGQICLDVVYNPPVTHFMKLCAERGAIICNGLPMLYGQAIKNAEIWGLPIT